MVCAVVSAVHSGERLPDMEVNVRVERGVGNVVNDIDDDNLLPLLLIKLNFVDELLLKLYKEVERFVCV